MQTQSHPGRKLGAREPLAMLKPPWIDLLGHFSWIDLLGYVGTVLGLVSVWMKRMVPLRAVSIAANGVFLVYAFLYPVYPQLFLQMVLLPLNALRLNEMLQLTQRV